MRRQQSRSMETMETPTAAGPSRAVVVLLVVIVLVGTVLRFHGLDTQSLWNDELWTWQMANKDRLWDVLTTGQLPRDVHPPLYFILHYYLQKYVGDSETLLRLPSAVAGVLAIVAIYLLGRRLWGDAEGLTAAALTAVMHFPIRYSQEARAYSMLFLASILSMYFWIPVVRSLCEKRRPGLRAVVAYVTAAAVTSYLHYFGLYLVALEAVAAAAVLLVKRPRASLWLGVLYVPVALVYVPWFPMMVRALGIRQFWIGTPTSNPFEALQYHIGFMVNESHVLTWVALALFAWLLGRTLYDRYGSKGKPAAGPATPHAGLLVVLWLFVPAALVWVKSLVSTPVVLSRNMIIALAAGYLLMARAIVRIPLRRPQQAVLVALIALGLAAHLVFGMHFYSAPYKDQFRDAVRFTVEHPRFREDALIIGVCHGSEFFNYYFKRLGSFRTTDLLAGPKKDIPKVAEAIARRNPRYIWLLYGQKMPDPEFMAYMQQNFQCVDAKILPVRAGAILYRNTPPRRPR